MGFVYVDVIVELFIVALILIFILLGVCYLGVLILRLRH